MTDETHDDGARQPHPILKRSDFITDKEDDERCRLIDLDINGELSEAEGVLLSKLDEEIDSMLEYLAPLPIDEAVRFHNRMLEARVNNLEAELNSLQNK